MRITADWITAEATQAVCRMLESGGYLALFVGGCVRNALLGMPVRDIDLATDALPQEVMRLAALAGLKAVPTGIDHGTVTVVANHRPFEITTFRKDVETDGRRAVVAFSTRVEDDARRRDFTMNALYAHPDGRVIDPLGGLPDLRAGRLRFIEDAGRRIEEDYLRILRFFRFFAWYGDQAAGLDGEALAAIADHLGGLTGLSAERVGAEMVKLLAAPDPCIAVAGMRSTGVLAAVLPGATDQALGPLVHLEAMNAVPPDAIRRLAVLGGDDPATRFRLSKAQAKQFDLLREMTGAAADAGELGYHYGAATARDVLLLRAAVSGHGPDPGDFKLADLGAQAKFPVSAADFQPDLSGAALGRALREAETAWIASGFTLTRDELLAR